MFDLVAAHAPRLWQRLNHARLALEVALLRGGAVYRGSSRSGAVALTFDDGPDPRWTPRVLEALATADARATFFFLAAAIEAHPALAWAAAQRHQIGTHLYDHSLAPTRSAAAFEVEMARVNAIHERVLGERPKIVRFPHGRTGRIEREQLAAHGLRAYHWTFSSEDARAGDGEQVALRVAPRLASGCIVLLHDGRGAGSTQGPGHREATIAALPAILAAVARRGLEATTLAQLEERGA
jgi:peptidoglycan-N-acetylglucosamine deacetylase